MSDKSTSEDDVKIIMMDRKTPKAPRSGKDSRRITLFSPKIPDPEEIRSENPKKEAKK